MEKINIGLIPPQALELEEAILGAIMLERTAFNKVSEILKKDTFYKPAYSFFPKKPLIKYQTVKTSQLYAF